MNRISGCGQHDSLTFMGSYSSQYLKELRAKTHVSYGDHPWIPSVSRLAPTLSLAFSIIVATFNPFNEKNGCGIRLL